MSTTTHLRAGEQSDRFGTWALASLVFLFLPIFQLGPFAPFAWGTFGVIPAGICAGATLAAIGCGLVGLASHEREQRRAAAQGLLKASPVVLVGGWYVLLFAALLTGDWNLG
jgi:hypothetical protein